MLNPNDVLAYARIQKIANRRVIEQSGAKHCGRMIVAGRGSAKMRPFAINTIRGTINPLDASWKRAENVENEPVNRANEDS